MTLPGPSDSSGDNARLHGSPHAMAAWQNAQQYLQNQRYTAAVAAYRKLTQDFPGVAKLWGGLGMAAAGDLDFALAEEAYQRAMELSFADVDLLLTLATSFYRLHRFDLALACQERAVAVNPNSIPARLSLASWFERVRRLDDAWECVEACLKQHPTEPRALRFKAFLLHRKERNAEAETVLRDLLKNEAAVPPPVRADAFHLLGTVLDALGQYAGALEFMAKSNALRRQLSNAAALEQVYDKVTEARRKVVAEMTPDTIKRWREEAAASPAPNPLVFLGGAPRSGTTLLEQILGAHPGILIYDEPQAFAQELFTPLHPLPPARGLTLSALNGLTAQTRNHLMDRYFKSLSRERQENPAGRLMLDKNPSVTMSLPIWLRLFPASKVIIAVRDPRDVVLSSYFQNINPVWANVCFLGLERMAKFYADTMDIWLRLRDLGGFEWIEARYENVVENLEEEGRRVTAFLGLEWDQAQGSFYAAARKKFVHSPTYDEVTKPVYRRAMGRWEHYAGALAPCLPGLQPYLRTFGYV
jgi:tetratricopeptide (TPR) repeat protein